MSRAVQLKVEIDRLEAEHLKVSLAGKAAIAQMGSRPQDGATLIAEANTCFARAAAIRRDLDNFDAALDAARELDKADEVTSFEKSNRDRLAQVLRLAADRIALGRQIDKAKVALDAACGAYRQAGVKIASLAAGCVNTTGMLPSHRADAIGYIRDAAMGMGVDFRKRLDGDENAPSIEQLAKRAEATLRARLNISDEKQEAA